MIFGTTVFLFLFSFFLATGTNYIILFLNVSELKHTVWTDGQWKGFL